MHYQGNQRNFNPRGAKGELPDESRIKKILAGDAKELNEYADDLAVWYVKGKDKEKLTTSQIRNVLDEIQKMKDYDEYRLQMLRPKLAYAAGRQHKGKVKEFRDLMEVLIRNTNKTNFSNFKNFVEAIVAYHKFYDGK
ncbi:MAG: type III-A CRISPR-associated protein Csm2 [Candidatus Aminicenantes bacterium]|nr:type III-A CRISPR-associated protein Csm2 [Candidatus Aminicenantes bacterium]